MTGVAQRWDTWLDFVADLAARPSPEFPRTAVRSMLRESFQTRVSYNWVDGPEVYGFDIDDPAPGWPSRDEADYWARVGLPVHPILCFYAATGTPRPMSIGRVPRSLVPPHGFAVVRDCLQHVGLEQQLSIPLHLTPTTSQAFVLAQTGDDYGDEDVQLARLIQPLLALLHRQAALLSTADCDAAAAAGVTGRELAVLRLLAEGRTAVAIGHVLRISPRTVHTHLGHLYRKLGVADRVQAVLVARELGILPDPSPRDVLARDHAGQPPQHPA